METAGLERLNVQERLLGRHEDLGLDSSTHGRGWVWLCIGLSSPSTVGVRQEAAACPPAASLTPESVQRALKGIRQGTSCTLASMNKCKDLYMHTHLSTIASLFPSAEREGTVTTTDWLRKQPWDGDCWVERQHGNASGSLSRLSSVGSTEPGRKMSRNAVIWGKGSLSVVCEHWRPVGSCDVAWGRNVKLQMCAVRTGRNWVCSS